MLPETKDEMIARLTHMIGEIAPSAAHIKKYGGVLCVMPGQKDEQGICGYVVYSNHITLEFPFGHRLKDPHEVLEGKGKYRRHIKLTSLTDIKHKYIAEYIKAAVDISGN